MYSEVYSRGIIMTHLTPSPIYTIGMVKFPRVPGIERFIDSFHDKIRGDYPLCDEFKVSVLNTDLGSQGVHFVQQENKVWQFTSVDQSWAFILTDQSLCLHTVNYQHFHQFSERFQKGLTTILNIQEIGIDWMTTIGIRYISLIKALPNKQLNDYIQSWVLPSDPSQESLTSIEGAYITRYKTNKGELRLQTLLNPQLTLPPELQTSLIIKNGWAKNRPQNDFAVIDIDHSISFDLPTKMTSLKALEELSNLHKISKTVFESIGTKLFYSMRDQ